MAYVNVETDDAFFSEDRGDTLDVEAGNLLVMGPATETGAREVLAIFAPGRWIAGWKSDTDPFPES